MVHFIIICIHLNGNNEIGFSLLIVTLVFLGKLSISFKKLFLK